MRRVDFIGVPGVGKSVLFRALTRRPSRVDPLRRWHTELEVTSQLATASAQSRGIQHSVGLSLAQAIPVLRRRAAIRYTRALRATALLDFSASFAPFVSFCFATIAAHHAPVGQQLLTLRDLIATLESFATCHMHGRHAHILWDESLTHRVHAVARSTTDWRSHARRYLELMPLPMGVIHVKADHELTLQRIQTRRATQIAGCHIGLHANAVRQVTTQIAEILEFAAQFLAARGVDVVAIDAAQPLAYQVEHVKRFLTRLDLRDRIPTDLRVRA